MAKVQPQVKKLSTRPKRIRPTELGHTNPIDNKSDLVLSGPNGMFTPDWFIYNWNERYRSKAGIFVKLNSKKEVYKELDLDADGIEIYEYLCNFHITQMEK